MINLGQIKLTRKTGNEKFYSGKEELGFQLLDFWQWISSDVLNNTTRGLLAEYLVARALSLSEGIRVEWDAYDLEFDGLKIEVKSAGYLQSWHQSKLTIIKFGTQKAFAWDKLTGKYEKSQKRQADIYVFALLAHQEYETVNPMNVEQWEFYVMPSEKLGERKSISFKILHSMSERVTYGDLKTAIEKFRK